MFQKKLPVGGQHVLLQSSGTTCEGGHACNGVRIPPSEFPSMLRSFLIDSSAAHLTRCVVAEVTAIKIFHEILRGKDWLFCCVFLFLSWVSAVCRHAEPAHRGTLLVVGEALESFGRGMLRTCSAGSRFNGVR